jgi:hypothetical protein
VSDIELEALATRVSMLELHVYERDRLQQGREQTIVGLAWGVVGLCCIALGAVIYYGAYLIGG